MAIPQRDQENNTPTKIVKVTPQMMAMILKSKDNSQFVPATLIRNDAGEHIIRPILSLLNH